MIKRYNLQWEWMAEHPTGEYVKYEDYVAAMAMRGIPDGDVVRCPNCHEIVAAPAAAPIVQLVGEPSKSHSAPVSAPEAGIPASRAAAANAEGQTTNPMCERKTDDIMAREGYRKTGYVLMKDYPAARICVSDQGAVSWFTRDQWNWLMHNRDHVEFQWPKPIGAARPTAADAGDVSPEAIVAAVHAASATGRVALTITDQHGAERPTNVAECLVRALRAELAGLWHLRPSQSHTATATSAKGPALTTSTADAKDAARLHGFDIEDLTDIAEELSGSAYEQTINVGNVTGMGDELHDSAPAAAAKFIRAAITSSAGEVKP